MTEPVEGADSRGPHNLGFRIDDGRATARYYVRGDELADWVVAITGNNDSGTDGRIARTLPCSYGFAPFLYGSSVNAVGLGVNAVEDASADDNPIASQFAVYPEYELQVEFLQRPYGVLPDDEIDVVSGLYYDENNELVLFNYATEWLRFCEVDEVFDAKFVTATQGELKFRTASGGAPDGRAFPNSPRIPLPEFTLTVKWHQVPFRYVTSRNSFLKRLALKVNQNPFTIQDYYFEPGELLYYGYKYRRYTPPFPAPDASGLRFALEKWCDVDLTFGVAYGRGPTDVPATTNANWVAAGHNLQPNFKTRKFYYVSSSNDQHPLFESAPLEQLWTDPDAPQP